MATRSRKAKPTEDKVPEKGRLPEEKGLPEKEGLTVKEKIPAKKRISKLMENAVGNFEDKFQMKDLSFAEYLKLLQMMKEIEEQEETAKEIKVTWVDPEGSESSK